MKRRSLPPKGVTLRPSFCLISCLIAFFLILFSLFFHFYLSHYFNSTNEVCCHSISNELLELKTSLNHDVQPTIAYINTKPRGFLLVSPSPTVDQSNAVHIFRSGVVSPILTLLFYKLLKDECRPRPAESEFDFSSRPLVVDVGANMGYFSTYSAMMGCRVVSFEPQPILNTMIKLSLALNSINLGSGRSRQLHLHNQVVSSQNSKHKFELDLSFWGHSRLKKDGEKEEGKEKKKKMIEVEGVKLGDVVREKIFILKVDVEGWEMEVMNSSFSIFGDHGVQNVFLEWKEVHEGDRARGKNFLEKMVELGYKVIEFHEDYLVGIDDEEWGREKVRGVKEVKITKRGKDLIYDFPVSNNIWFTKQKKVWWEE